MRCLLAWLLFIQFGLSKPYSNSNNIGSVHPRHGEESSPKISTAPSKQDVPSLAPNDASPHSRKVEKRDELPAGTHLYVVWVTDRENESHISETRKWLEGIVQDKSRITERTSFTWMTPEDVPEKELQKLWDEGRFDQEIDNYQRVDGWSNLLLDQAGYDTVSNKKEWISDIAKHMIDVEMIAVHGFKPKRPKSFEKRKVEWGD